MSAGRASELDAVKGQELDQAGPNGMPAPDGDPAGPPVESSPRDVIKYWRHMAEEGTLPVDLLRRAQEATDKRDVKQFLVALDLLLDRQEYLQADDFLQLAQYSSDLGLKPVLAAILACGLLLYPKDKTMRRLHLEQLAHSDRPRERERGRMELLKELDITITDGQVSIPKAFDTEKFTTLGVMLDAYHADDLNVEALAVVEAFLHRFPESTIVVRNYARALEALGRADEALICYQQALHCPDVDDVSAIWLGSELHNRSRHVDAAEAYALASILDPDDAAGFARLADEVSQAIQEQQVDLSSKSVRHVPNGIGPDAIEGIVTAALSCPLLRESELQRCLKASSRMGLSGISLDKIREHGMPRGERQALAARLYGLLRSEITDLRQPAFKDDVRSA